MRALIALGIVVLAVSVCKAPPPPPKLEPVVVERGQAVTLGSFSCQVDTVETDTVLGDKYVYAEPTQGTFWLVKLSVSNTGPNDAFFNTDSFRLVVDSAYYLPDTTSAKVLGDAAFRLHESLGAGTSRSAYLVFDLPTAARPSYLGFQRMRFALPRPE